MPNTEKCPSKAEPCRQEAGTVKELCSMAWACEGSELSQGPGSNSSYQGHNSCEVVTTLEPGRGRTISSTCSLSDPIYTLPQFAPLTQTPTKGWEVRGGNWDHGAGDCTARSSYRPRLAQVEGGMVSGASHSSSILSHQRGTDQRE